MTTPGAILDDARRHGTLSNFRERSGRPQRHFSLGAVLFEMATGKMLAADASGAALDRVPAPPLLIRIIRKRVEPDPDNRWQSAADLVDPLQWSEDASPGAAAPIARPGIADDGSRGSAVLRRRRRSQPPSRWNASRAAPATPRSMRVDVLAPRGTMFTPRDRTRHRQFALARWRLSGVRCFRASPPPSTLVAIARVRRVTATRRNGRTPPVRSGRLTVSRSGFSRKGVSRRPRSGDRRRRISRLSRSTWSADRGARRARSSSLDR